MQVATKSYKNVTVRIILDIRTMPDWISRHFLTDTLKMSYSKLTSNESKQVFKDFNRNASVSGMWKGQDSVAVWDLVRAANLRLGVRSTG
jgi:hypothetical protein